MFTFAISLSAVTFGAHLSKLLLPYFPTPKPPSRPIRYALSALAVLVFSATSVSAFGAHIGTCSGGDTFFHGMLRFYPSAAFLLTGIRRRKLL